jgi:peroxiredoxin
MTIAKATDSGRDAGQGDESGPEKVQSGDYFAGKKVALFSVPGAFTPTCSAKHLPGFVDKAAELKAKGVDEIVATAVNDAFVLGAWNKASGSARHHHARRRQRRVRRGARADDGRLGLRHGQARPALSR